MHVSTVEQMRSMDRTAIEQYGIPAQLLIENAGHAVYSVIQSELGAAGKRFVVFCGLGNNGGDGLVVARKLHSSGAQVRVLLLGDPDRYAGAARVNYEIAGRLGLSMARLDRAEAAREHVDGCDAVVDALLGTGLTRRLEGTLREVADIINQSGRTVFAVDIPSGVQGDTGQILGAAVRADYTVTFGLPKLGNVLAPGCHQGGRLYVSNISFPPSLTRADSLQVAINTPLPLPARNPAGHKGTFGQVLFIAGAAGYYGAPSLAALSFLKAGGGYARLAVPRSVAPVIAARGSEIVFVPQPETPAGTLSREAVPSLLELAGRMDLVVLGPGLSLEPETQEAARELAAAVPCPLLIDGDGITAVAEQPEIVRRRHAETVLTPHLGEMSRLTDLDIPSIQADRVQVLLRTTRQLDALVVLKGSRSLIGTPDGRVFINLSGNSGMATAGSGDVLTGAIGAMFGLGLPLEDAVRQGVLVHGLAGDLAAADQGEDGITASDLQDALPRAVRALRQGPSAQDDPRRDAGPIRRAQGRSPAGDTSPADAPLGGWLRMPVVI